jgi:hypothetical protein
LEKSNPDVGPAVRMKDISDAVSGFIMLIVVFSLVVVFLLLSRSTFLPVVDTWIIDALKFDRVPLDVKQLTANQPCWSGYQCLSGFCIKKGTIDETTFFSSGVCSESIRGKGCTTEITLGLTTRSMCVN